MKACSVLLAALCAVVGAKKVEGPSTMFKQITSLLNNMANNLEKEGNEAREEWAKAKCLCDSERDELETTIQEKAEAIAQAEADTEAARASAATASTNVAEAKTQIRDLNKDRKEGESVRAKQHAAFKKEEGELQALIKTLNDAIANLADGSFLQTTSSKKLRGSALTEATKTLLQDLLPEDKHAQALVQGSPTANNKVMIEQVSLTLQGLKKQFKAQLEDATAQEAQEKKTYNEWKANNNNQKAFNTNLQSTSEKSLANTDDIVEKAAPDIDHDGLDGLKETLANHNAACSESEDTYNTHSKLRAEEQASVSQALSVIESDEAKDLFRALDAHGEREKKYAREGDGPDGALLFLQEKLILKLAGKRIDKVVNQIQEQVADLNQDQADDEHWKEECAEKMSELRQDAEETKSHINELHSDEALTQNQQEAAMKHKEETLESKASLIAHMQQQTENYMHDNATYTKAVADGHAAFAVIGKVVEALQAGPGSSGTYKSQEDGDGGKQGGKSATALLQNLQKDIKKKIEEENTSFAQETKEYNGERDDDTAMVKEFTDDVSHFSEVIADTEARLGQLGDELDLKHQHLEAVHQDMKEAAPRCFYIKTQFDARKTHRDAEIAGLNGAIDALKGA